MHIQFAVLDGELAVPCNPQSATAGLNSQSAVQLCGVWSMRKDVEGWVLCNVAA